MSHQTFLTTVACFSLCLAPAFADQKVLTPREIPLNVQTEKKLPKKSPTVKASFSPFTGKVKGNKVRLRLQPDLEGHIVKELQKDEIVAVVDQEGEFYAIEAPTPMKAYVFRSFVLDNVVEGNRVNVRTEPDLEAPVIGHLNSGDHIEGAVCAANKKWLEIDPPAGTKFFVSKDLIDSIGGPNLKEELATRKVTAEQLLEAAQLFAQAEFAHPFEEIQFEQVKQGFLSVIHDYSDFTDLADSAKSELNKAQESYMEKRIAYLEDKAALASGEAPASAVITKAANRPASTGMVQMWSAVEEGLYAEWAKVNDQQGREQYWDQQKATAVTLSGTLEPYKTPVKNRPGDYVLKNKNIPVAYVYSTNVQLEDFVGKKITLTGSARPNHNFAFPAYFVHTVE